MKTCKDCIHCDVCVRQNIYGEYAIVECKGHFLGKADVQEVKHGEWQVTEHGAHLDVVCTNCKKDFYVYKKGQYRIDVSNYCPNCGAKMDKGGVDNG